MAISRPADRAQPLARQRHQVLALEADRAPLDDAARRIDQAEDREAGDGLAGARFAYQAQHLARRHVEVDAVDRLDDARLGEEMRAQVCGRWSASARHPHLQVPRIQHVAQLVADEVDAEMVEQASATPGKKLIQ